MEKLEQAVREFLAASDEREVDANRFFAERGAQIDYHLLGYASGTRPINLLVAFMMRREGGLGIPPIRSALGPHVAWEIIPNYFIGNASQDLILKGSEIDQPAAMQFEGGRWFVAQKGRLIAR